jgi:hypothetical protein
MLRLRLQLATGPTVLLTGCACRQLFGSPEHHHEGCPSVKRLGISFRHNAIARRLLRHVNPVTSADLEPMFRITRPHLAGAAGSMRPDLYFADGDNLIFVDVTVTAAKGANPPS